MFTQEETQFLIRVTRVRCDPDEANHIACHILRKLESIDDYKVTLHCYGCNDDLHPDLFAGDYSCRRCGARICDACEERWTDLCDECACQGPDPKEDWWEYADIRYDEGRINAALSR